MLRSSTSKVPAGRSRTLIPLEYVEAYNFQAVDFCKDGEVEGAIVALGKGLSLDPESEPALFMRGALWLDQGHPQKAITDHSNAIARTEETPPLLEDHCPSPA